MREILSHDFQLFIPDSLIEYSNSSFQKIKAYADTHLEIAVQCSIYLNTLNYNRLINQKTKKDTEFVLKKYKEAIVGIYQKDFILYQKLNELEDPKYLKEWNKIQVENYYFLFNYLPDGKNNTTEKIKTLLLRQFYFEAINELPSDVAAELHKILQERRDLFSSLFEINEEVLFDFTEASYDNIDDNHIVFLNHIRRMFFERKAFFLSILEVNFIQIEHFLNKIDKFEEKDGEKVPVYKYRKNDFKEDLQKYVHALNNSHDFIFFKTPNEPKKEFSQNVLKEQTVDEKLDDLLKTIEKLNNDFSSTSAAITLEKIDKIHTKVFEVKKEEAKTFYKDYFQKGKFSTLKPEKQQEFVYSKITALGSIAAKDIGSGLIDIFNAKDKEKAAEKLAKKLVNDILPVAMEALGIAFGGPLLGSFLQGLTGSILGAMFGKPPSPFDALKEDIKRVDHHIEILQNIVVKGFNKVLEDTSLIIQKEEKIQQLIVGLGEKIDDEFSDLKDFLKNLIKEGKAKNACEEVIKNINTLHYSYEKLITDKGSGNIEYIGENVMVNGLRTMMNYLIYGNASISNYDFITNDYTWLQGISKDSPFYEMIDKSKDGFGKTTASIVNLFSVTDRTLNLYAQYRKLHFVNNAIIGFIATGTKVSDAKNGDTRFVAVLKDLFNMQQVNNEGLLSALQMHGKLLEASVVGKNNLELYSKYVNSSKNERLSFLDSFALAEVTKDTHQIIMDDKEKHIPKWIVFDSAKKFSENKTANTFNRYYAANLGKDKLINFGDKTSGYIFLPTLDQVVFKLDFHDTIRLMDKNKTEKIARLVPYDYFYTEEKSNEKHYIFKDELEFLFTKSAGLYFDEVQHYQYYKNNYTIKIAPRAGCVLINKIEVSYTQIRHLPKETEKSRQFPLTLERKQDDEIAVYLNIYHGNPDGDSEYLMNYSSHMFFKFDVKTKDNAFEIGDEIYSPNRKYKLHYTDDDLVIENVDTGEIKWSLGLFASVDKKKDQNVMARLYLEDKVLKFKYCSNTKEEDPKYVDNFSFEFPQKEIIKLWLDDNGTIQILQKCGSKKYRQRRLIHRILREGDYLLPGEYLYEYNVKQNYPRHLLLKEDGNLITNAAIPGKTPKPIWDANLKREKARDYRLCIKEHRLIIENTDKKVDDFVFTQRYVENLYIDDNSPYINLNTIRDEQRRLFLYTLKKDDVLYENEALLSPNHDYSFKILPKGKIQCNKGEKKIWSSGGNLDKKDLKFKSHDADYEDDKYRRSTGETFQFYDRNDKNIDKSQRGFYLRTVFEHDKSNKLYSTIGHAEENKDYGGGFDNIYMLYMTNKGKLIGKVVKHRISKYFDLGLNSSHSQHSAPEVKLDEDDWINGPKE